MIPTNSMFEYLTEFIGKHDGPNDFYAVSKDDVAKAEERLGFKFPSQLKTFYAKIGCGFLQVGTDDTKRDPSVINRIVAPKEVADLLLDKNSVMRPYEGFVKGVMPFFEVGESTYLVVRPKSSSPNTVFWPDGKQVISETLSQFFQSLYKNAGFYRNL